MVDAAWLEVKVTVDDEVAEAVSEVLARHVENGIVIQRGVTYNDAEDVGTPFGPCIVSAYLPIDENLETVRQQIQHDLWFLGRISPIPEPVFTPIADEDWMASWKKFYHPIIVGKKFLILPPWIPNEEPDRIPINIDPGMAFGTGTHPTTQLCLALLEDYVFPGQPMIDMGCGSGILSIGALLLGASQALGIDIDEESMVNSRANAELNGVADRLEVSRGVIPEILAGKYGIRQAPVVTANILTPILIDLFEQGMADLIEPGGVILLSGILEEQDARITASFESKGLHLIEKRQINDWVAYACGKSI
ncbi:MAG: 50S ribosomal protein L11 methyltransferase [Chloroflexi bacterium]|nr:50S ribosomal protein L11 methyltransferase [Chloroflexota bacterium]